MQLLLYSDGPFIADDDQMTNRNDGIYVRILQLIKTLHRIEQYEFPFKISVAITPVVLEFMNHPECKQLLLDYTRDHKNVESEEVAEALIRYDTPLQLMRRLVEQEKIECLASPVNGSILPFHSIAEAIRLQIREGISLVKSLLHVAPKGFWFPKGAYATGLDLYLIQEGIEYTYLPARTIKFADPAPLLQEFSAVVSPHGLICIPLQEDLAQHFQKGDYSTGYFQIRERIHSICTEQERPMLVLPVTFETIATQVTDFFEVIYELFETEADPHVSLDQTLMEKRVTLPVVHLCNSFLEGHFPNNEESELHYSLQVKLHEIERELFSFLITYTSDQQEYLLLMMKKWLLLTGIVSHFSQEYRKACEVLIKEYVQLKSMLLGNSTQTFYPRKDITDNVLNQISLKKMAISRTEIRNGQKRVLMLTWEYPPNVVGGLARHVQGISEGLGQLGYEMDVITAQAEGLKDYEYQSGVHIHRIQPLHTQEHDFLHWIADLNAIFVEKAIELCKSKSFHFIHGHDWLVGSAAITISETIQRPLIATIHATEFGRNHGLFTEMQRFIDRKERQLMERATKLIVCSDFMKGELETVFNMDTQKVTVIPNGIDDKYVNITHDDDPFFFSNIEGKQLIFSIGRMVMEKGFDTLIKAAKLLKPLRNDLVFVIAGKGPMLDEYRQVVLKEGLEESVHFIGYISDEQRDAFLRICKMTIFPSLYEPFGIVALESMIFAKPTIVSSTGGLKDIISHKKTGLLMIPGDVDSLIEQIQFLLLNEDEAIKIGNHGRTLVKSLYSWSKIADQTKDVYESIQ